MRQVTIETELDVVLMTEGNMVVIYSPALDLSTCGATQEEAKRNLVEAVNILYDECLRRGTLEALLASLGWKKSKKPAASAWTPPEMSHDRIPVSLLAAK